jgi:hypothetical protein
VKTMVPVTFKNRFMAVAALLAAPIFAADPRDDLLDAWEVHNEIRVDARAAIPHIPFRARTSSLSRWAMQTSRPPSRNWNRTWSGG